MFPKSFRLKYKLTFVICCFVSILFFNLAAETKIAILGDIEKNRAEIDLLTERLSKNPGITLVERSEIDRIIAEQGLSSLSGENALKLGAMLGAKGMIIIKSFEWEGKNVLSARLVAAESGAITGVWVQDTPSTEAFHFADAVKFAFNPLFSKLELNRKDITALSLLNIRAAVDSPEAKELERKITLLLSQRLMCEKTFVVLERWRLSNVAWEKELNLDNNPFWTGSYVLDGSVESLHDGKGSLKVILRLRKAGDKEASAIELSGSTLDLKAFVENMAVSIREKLGASSGGTVSWDMKKEADFYFNEAQWLLRAGSFERAREASDAAAALGKTGPEIYFTRIRSYLGENGKIRNGTENNSVSGKNMPLSEKLDRLIAALDIYINFVEKTPKSLSSNLAEANDWRMLGRDLMLASSELLKEYSMPPFMRPGLNKPEIENQEKFKMLRSMLRKAIALTMDKGDDSYTMRLFYYYYIQSPIDLVFEKSEDLIGEYRKLITRKFPVQTEMHYEILQAMTTKMRQSDQYLFQEKMNGGQTVNLCGFLRGLHAELETSGRKIDALVLAGKTAPSEKISDALWEYREQIVNGDGKTGDSPQALLYSVNCPPEIVVKLLLHAFSKGEIPDGDGNSMSNLMQRLEYMLRESGISDDDKRKIGEAWDKVKPLFTGNSDREFIDGKIGKLLSSRQVSKSAEAVPAISPLFTFEFPESRETNFRLNNVSFRNGFLQASGYFNSPKKAFIIYSDENSRKLNFIASPEISSFKTFGGWHMTSAGLMLKTEENIYYASQEGKVYLLEKSGDWKKLADTGLREATAMTASGNKLYAAFGHLYNTNNPDENLLPSGIVQLDAGSRDMKIIAASRRNPPLSPLDNCPAWLPVMLECSDNGMLASCIVSGETGHWSASFYELDTVKDKWACNYRRKGIGVINAEHFIRDIKYPVFDKVNGTLKQFNIGLLFVEMVGRNMQSPDYLNFMKSKTVVCNGKKIFRILQLDENAFDIKALDTGDSKISGQTFRINPKSFPSDYKYMTGCAVSDKLIYILMSPSKSDDLDSICILALEQEKILKSVDAGKLKHKNPPLKTKELEALQGLLPNLMPGLRLNFYKGAWQSVVNYIPDTLLMKPFSSQIVSNMKVSGLEWDEDAVFSFRGCLKAEKEGKYSFNITNRKSKFKVHIDTARDNDRRNIRDVILKPGVHSIRIDILAKGPQKDIEILLRSPGEKEYKSLDGMVFYNPDGN